MQSKFFNTPFATAGDKIDIPDAAQVDGSVSFATGFGPDYEKELGVDPDAKPVPRDATNGVLFDLTDAVGAIQKQGAPQFIEAADNGGAPFSYGRGARVMYGSPARPWVSRVDNNTTTPVAGPNWALEVFEAATNAQAIAGTDPSVMITPPGLQAALSAAVVTVPDATETVKGIQRNATQAEANAGALDNATMTPVKTAGAIAQQVPAATTSVAGRTRYATVGETAAVSSGTLAVTPAGLAQTREVSWITGLQLTLDGKANLAGAVFSGGVAISLIANDAAGFRVTNQSTGPNALAAYYFGNDIDGSFSAYIAKNGSGNTAGAGPSSWRFFNGQNTPILFSISGVGDVLRMSSAGVAITGAATATGGFQNVSSRTVKDHVADISPAQALKNVLAFRGVLYRYHGSEQVRAGYYAEEVRESRPEAVSEGDENSSSPLLLENAQMLPDHTGAIQELYRMILELQEKSK